MGMGSNLEFNDTLQITTAQGFPPELKIERHRRNPFTAKDFEGKIFSFHGKPGARIFHPAPTRCFLVHNIGGKWLYWGKIVVIEQTIHGETTDARTTSGKYKIVAIYDPEYQEKITRNETNPGESYF